MVNGIRGDKPRIKVCLTIDVEWDYARSRSVSILEHTDPFFQWLRQEQVPFTAFVTGRLLEQNHPMLESLEAAGVPIGVHGFEHSTERFGNAHSRHEDEIRRGTDAYLKRFGRPAAGYRAPAGIVSPDDVRLLDTLGFRYDASVFPLHRPHRYDFSKLPRTPFRWEGTSLVEMPFGLLTNSLPAGMTFINLLGPALSAGLLERQARKIGENSPIVADMHFHNLFTCHSSMRGLPLCLRTIYLAGAWRNGLACVKSLVVKLRRAGAVFASLEAEALGLNAKALPVLGFDSFGCEP